MPKVNPVGLAMVSLAIGFVVGVMVSTATIKPIERQVDGVSSHARTLPWLILINIVGWALFLGVAVYA